jgi:FtsP/CotA-like multicopper oxidase with cupredoxin domain
MISPVLRPTRRAVSFGLAANLVSLGRPAAQPAAGALPFTAAPLSRRLPARAEKEAQLWAFNGEVPGPVVRIRLGDELHLRLDNRTPAPLSLHWHGVRGPNGSDGVGGLTQEPVPPGASYEYRFTPPDPGTYLIRPCVVGHSAEATERGLSAILVVEEPSPPQVDADYALVVDDWRLEPDGSLAPFGQGVEANAGRLGNWLGINASEAPARIEAAPGSRVRLRLGCACNARVMRIRFEGLKVWVVGIDGQPTPLFEPLNSTLPFAPGNRYDLLVDMPPEAGPSGSVIALLGQGTPLVTLTSGGPSAAGTGAALPPVAALPPNPKLPAGIRLQNAIRKDVLIEGALKPPEQLGPNEKPWTINGVAGTVGMRPLMSVKRGSVVVLALANKTPLIQPFHLHGHVFRLLHPFDDGWEPYWIDTLQVPENRTLRIAFQADNPGKWLLASTAVERFDTGLWTWLEVT